MCICLRKVFTQVYFGSNTVSHRHGETFRASQHRLGCDFLNIMLTHKGEKTHCRTNTAAIDKQPWNESNILSHQFCCKDLTRFFFQNRLHKWSTHLEINLTPSNNAPSWSIQYGTPPYSWTRVLAFTSLGVRSILTFPSPKLQITCGQWKNRSMYVTKVRGVVFWKNISLQCVHLHAYKSVNHGCIYIRNISYVSTPFLRTTDAYRIASSVWKSLTSHQAQIRTSQLYKKMKTEHTNINIQCNL